MRSTWSSLAVFSLLVVSACTESTVLSPEMHSLSTPSISKSASVNPTATSNRSSACPAANRQGAIRGNSSADPVAGAQSNPNSQSAFNFGGCGDDPLEGPYGVGCRLGGQSVVMTPPSGDIAFVVFVWNQSNGDYVDAAIAPTAESDGSYRVTTSSAAGIAKMQAQIIFADNSSALGYAECR
jgi:hypothetical protein